MADELTLTPPPVPTIPQIPPEVAQIIEQQRRELATIRSRESESAIRASLSGAISQHADRLVGGVAVEQLASLLRPGLRLVESGGESVVAGPSLQPVAEYVREQLDRPDYAHFQKPRGVGGTATGQTAQHGPTPGQYSNPGQPEPKNLGERIIANHKAMQAAIAAQGGSNPATNPALPFGLHPISK